MTKTIFQTGYEKALQLLETAVTAQGILASPHRQKNYARVWTRDAVICGLAGLMAQNEKIIGGLKTTLINLARLQGPEGQIPSNYQANDSGQIIDFSYGKLSPRLDTICFFIIGISNLVALQKDREFLHQTEQTVQKCLQLLNSWEYNQRGLMYIPQAGDWMDEIPRSGYILLEQLLRLWAIRSWSRLTGDDPLLRKAQQIADVVTHNFFVREIPAEPEKLYHSYAYQKCAEKQPTLPYWLEALAPGGYGTRFDAFANALALLLKVGSASERESTIAYALQLASRNPLKMVPNIDPPIDENDDLWPQLQISFGPEFRNYPHTYQNGGIWPMVNGWWGMALHENRRADEAKDFLQNLHRFNARGTSDDETWGFYEFAEALTGKCGGVRQCAWSAAAAVLVHHYLDGHRLWGL